VADDKLEIINPPNRLKEKVGDVELGAIDVEALEKAEQVIASLADSYLESVAQDIAKMDEAFGRLKAATGDRKQELDAVYQESFNLKGQGGSFGYDLMTGIGHELCRLIEGLDHAGPMEVAAIKLHIDAMKLVIADDMKGTGREAGQKLLGGLQQVCDRLLS